MDAEQIAKQQEIIDILVAAGYFRARIKKYDDFDKIVGGMVYCLEGLDQSSLDVDLLFHDSLTIGQKIALTEKIVSVLPQVGCPHFLEPHQIQGLDYISIFPVIQWLVKRSVESRAESADRLADFAVNQFHNDFELPHIKEIIARRQNMLGNLKELDEKFRPKRKFRKTSNVTDEKLSVRVTVMEYGGKIQATSSNKESVESQEEDVSELVDNLLPTVDEEEHTPFSHQNRKEVFDNYQNLIHEFGTDDKLLATQRQINLLKTTKENLEQRLDTLKDEIRTALDTKENKTKELADIKAYRQNLQTEVNALKTKHASEDATVIGKLTELLKQNEEVKQNEHSFKIQCKEELANMQSKVEELNRLASDDADEDQKQQLEIDKQNLAAIRLKLGKKNRQIVVMQRQLDNIPSRSEMAQYQRRFLELYNQVSAKQSETKKFYTLFNTLSDTKLYLEKEIHLLNSIFENFTTSMNSPPMRDQFLKQLEAIVMGVKENKNKVTKRLQDEKDKKEKLNADLLTLLDQQRKYAAAIKKLRQLMTQ